MTQRKFSSPTPTKTKMTAEEVEMALENANESMKAYYSYPPEKVIAAKKKYQKAFANQGKVIVFLCYFIFLHALTYY